MNVVRKKVVSILIVISVFTGLLISWCLGGFLIAPSQRHSAPLPPKLYGETVHFPSSSGAEITGWFIGGSDANAPVVILMHGVRGCREDMLERAKFLREAGYATMLFDFQAHGDSGGKNITFGYLESRDAQAAVEFVHRIRPKAKIGLIGVSMGAAAALLASPPLKVDSMILESVYPDIIRATEDRIVMRLGPMGAILAPLLTCQLSLRIGISTDQLRPIEGARKVSVPKYFFAGVVDQETTIQEAKEIFSAAAEPKQFWPVEKAGHVNLHTFAKPQYEKRVLEFFEQTLK